MACAVRAGAVRRRVWVNGREYVALLDSGADINLVTRKAAEEFGGRIEPTGKVVYAVGGKLALNEKVEFQMRLGEVNETITAHMVTHAPVDILLGRPFLWKHSEGYRMMTQEFQGEEETPDDSAACVIMIRDRLEQVLEKYPNLVLEKDEVPPPDRFYRGQSFELGIMESERDRIFFRAQYPPKPHEVDEFRKVMKPLIEAGVYQPSNSPHNNPAMLVPKKEPGTYRLVVDLREVNRVCQPVGGMSAATLDLVKVMGGAKIFTTIDIKNAFYSLVLAEKDRKYTAISLPGMARLELTRMPMGAKGSMAALYQAMVNTLGDALYKYAMVWADDIIIYSKNGEDHIKHVDDILKKLDRNGFCISRDKISLGQRQVKWLGYQISEEGVRPAEDKVQKILDMRRPRSIKELRSAIGMWTYFASFIPEYSIIASPLMAQLKKTNKTLVWGEECEKAWDEVKKRLANAPIMGYPDYSLQMYLHTDACKSGFAAILTQMQNGRSVIVDAASRTTNPAEKNYCSAKLECACVIWIARKWKHHLLSAPHTTIVTDSYGLQYLQQKGTRSALVERWICEMEGFSYSVRYRRGAENITDYLSRQYDVVAALRKKPPKKPPRTRSRDALTRPDYAAMMKGENKQKPIGGPKDDKPKRDAPKEKVPNEPSRKEIESSPTRDNKTAPKRISPKYLKTEIDIEELNREQRKDKYVQELWEIAQGKRKGEVSKGKTQDAEGIRKIAGVIVKDVLREETGEIRPRVVVPESLQKKVVEMIHNQNHAGIFGTLRKVQIDHWFRGMKKVAKEVVKHCEDCIAVKGRPITEEHMAPDDRPMALGDRWHIDGLYLPESFGYDHLLVATDVATKYVVLNKSLGETAQAVTDLLMEISTRFGPPKQVTTDQGRANMSNLMMQACHDLFIKFKPVGVKRPQANGMVERVNRTIKEVATTVCKGNQEIWANYVGVIEYVINTRISSVTKFSPYELVFGRQPPGPTYTQGIDEEGRRPQSEEEGVEQLRKRIRLLQEQAHRNQMEAAGRQLSYHDAHAKHHTFEVNDMVWFCKRSTMQKGVTSKLKYSWTGPFWIKEALGPVTFTLVDKRGEQLPGTYHSRYLYKVDE